MSNLWDFIWSAFLIFAFIVYIMILVSVLSDLFRDRALPGGYKALWIIFLVIFPYLAAFIYLIARGKGMAERQHEFAQRHQDEATAYIRTAAGHSPAAEIEKAKSLLDAGTITQDEYATLKARALA